MVGRVGVGLRKIRSWQCFVLLEPETGPKCDCCCAVRDFLNYGKVYIIVTIFTTDVFTTVDAAACVWSWVSLHL